MAQLKFFKVTVLPANLEADAFYYVENGTFAESYLTDDVGTARSIGNSLMIQAVVGPLIAAAVANKNQLTIAADIAARDALPDPDYNRFVLVRDASADANVDAGAALYVWDTALNAYTKVAEYESLDVQLTWAALQGKPTATPAEIDDAVTKRHTHANKAVLDKFGEAGGEPTYNGNAIGGDTEWQATDW